MLRLALKMLVGDRAKYAGLLIGITFTSFLVTFAASYFCGFMTRGLALITENAAADVWVMDPAVVSVEQTTNIPTSALARVRGVDGVRYALPLAVAMADARLPNGRFQPVQVIGVDDTSLAGVPGLANGGSPIVLRRPDAVIVDSGGTRGKLETARLAADQWPYGQPHLTAPTRPLRAGDELLVDDHRVRVEGRSEGSPRFPPRPLLYTTFTNAARILPAERLRLTFVLVTAAPGLNPRELAGRIETRTRLRARAAKDFEADTLRWSVRNSEDVGDIAAMLTLAMSVGLGVTGVMLYMFTSENRWQYAVLTAMGATPRVLLAMIFGQAAVCALVGTGLGLGLCAILSHFATAAGYPFRLMWFTPLVGSAMVVLVCGVAAVLSARPMLKLEPMLVFAAR